MLIKNIYNISTAHAVYDNEVNHNQFAFIMHTHTVL